MAKKATIKDIANELNIGIATVSRALSGNGKVHADTQSKILEVSKKLNYRPNLAAKNLVRNKSYTVGMLLHSIRFMFLEEHLKELDSMLREEQYELQLMMTYGKRDLAEKNIYTMIERGFDGVILTFDSFEVAPYERKIIQTLADHNIPYIIRGIRNDARVPQIDVDYYQCGYQITKHLIDLGHKNILFITDAKADPRCNGYISALMENGININNDNIFIVEPDYDKINSNFESIMERKPEAIFCNSDQMGYCILKLLSSNNIKVPEDISVAGTGAEYYSDMLNPPLTTYAPDYTPLSKYTAESILNQIKDNKKTTSKFLIGGKVIKRKSTSPRQSK